MRYLKECALYCIGCGNLMETRITVINKWVFKAAKLCQQALNSLNMGRLSVRRYEKSFEFVHSNIKGLQRIQKESNVTGTINFYISITKLNIISNAVALLSRIHPTSIALGLGQNVLAADSD